jgi:ribulose 1,5-bisphosphate synthetase/thiazole synthase
MRYSVLSLTWNAITGHKSWTPTWRDATPRTTYDVVIISGGGHGLATAYYLAKEHGITNVAVVCTENLVPIDLVRGSLNVGHDGRADISLREPGCLAL